jgi:hypothetical protein
MVSPLGRAHILPCMFCPPLRLRGLPSSNFGTSFEHSSFLIDTRDRVREASTGRLKKAGKFGRSIWKDGLVFRFNMLIHPLAMV